MWIKNEEGGKKPANWLTRVPIVIKDNEGEIKQLDQYAVYIAESNTWKAVVRHDLYDMGYEVIGWYESEEIVPKSPWVL